MYDTAAHLPTNRALAKGGLATSIFWTKRGKARIRCHGRAVVRSYWNHEDKNFERTGFELKILSLLSLRALPVGTPQPDPSVSSKEILCAGFTVGFVGGGVATRVSVASVVKRRWVHDGCTVSAVV